jgi:hypothetical protein
MSEIIIEPNRREQHYWMDLWRYRELIRVLAWRDLSVRYKQTVIGRSTGLASAHYDGVCVHDRIWAHSGAPTHG